MESHTGGRREDRAIIVMRTTAAAAVMAAALFAAQAPAAGQALVTSFDRLNTRVTVGDTVWLTDAQGREVTGRISELNDASITLDGSSRTRLLAGDVRLVERRTKSIGKAALWGATLGGVLLAGTFLIGNGSCESDCLGNSAAIVESPDAVLGRPPFGPIHPHEIARRHRM